MGKQKRRPYVSVALTREQMPCRGCKRVLPESAYKLPRSWYCEECRHARREAKRLNKPPSACDTCGVIKPQIEMMKTKQRCLECFQTSQKEMYVRKYKNHTYSTNRRAVNKRKQRQDPTFRLKENIRSLIANSIANQGYSKDSRTESILGCSYDQFVAHIEQQFKPGMSWNNRTEWHLDHIVPVSIAQTHKEIELLNHYTNFQPLWASENQSKWAHVDSSHAIFKKIIEQRK